MTLKYIFIILIILNLNRIDAKPKFNRKVGERAIFHAQNLLQIFPPSSHFIVGLGLSTALINAAVRVMLPEPDIEDSYLKEVPITKSFGLVGSQTRKKELVIKRMFPKKALIGNREIVLVRAVDQFETMESLLKLFFIYFAKTYPNSKINLYFIQKGESIQPDEVLRSIFIGERGSLGKIVLMNYDYYATWVVNIDRRENKNSRSPFRFMRFKPRSANDFLAANPPGDFEINPNAHLLTDKMRKFYRKLRKGVGEPGCNGLSAQSNQH